MKFVITLKIDLTELNLVILITIHFLINGFINILQQVFAILLVLNCTCSTRNIILNRYHIKYFIS